MKYKWEEIQKAVTALDRMKIEKIGKSYEKDRIVQDGLQIHEVAGQVLSMAPGDHPHLGPILLDLAAKLRDKNPEWH